MKTILFVSPTGTLDNGAEISIVHFMEFLVSEGYRVLNVAPQAHHASQIHYYETCMQKGIDTHFIPIQKWWWEDAPGQVMGTQAGRSSAYRENIHEIRQLIRDNQVDVVITNTVNMFQGAVASACEECKHFWLIHEFPENEFAYYQDKIDFIEQTADEIYGVVGKLNEALNQLFTTRKVKEFAPFTSIEATPIQKSGKRRFVSVGRLSERKNQLELLKAYALLEDQEVELVFIGAWDEAYRKKCDQFIKEHKLKNVTFTGNLANPWATVTQADICIFPSKMETFGLVYVEAVLNGVPTILSDNPGHQSAYQLFEMGHLYPSGNTIELARTIRAVLDDFDQEHDHALKNQAVAEEKYKLHNVYRDILADIDADEGASLKGIRHLAPLLSSNEPKSKLAKLETRARNFMLKVRYKLLKK